MANRNIKAISLKLAFNSPIWIEGNSFCGKTSRLIEIFTQWSSYINKNQKKENNLGQSALIFCANNRGRIIIENLILSKTNNLYPYKIKTPFGFIIEEVNLFFPLILEQLDIKAQFSLRLRPETEQELATKLWHSQLTPEIINLFGGEYNFVRRCLDLMQLAGCGGIPPEEISTNLRIGLEGNFDQGQGIAELMGKLILEWRKWCLEKGLLSYGLIYELYWRYLLPNLTYQTHLSDRYCTIFADDVDDYPAIAGDTMRLFLENAQFGAFTYNNQGKIRLGLNADPEYLANLAEFCQIESLNLNRISTVADKLQSTITDLLEGKIDVTEISSEMRSLHTRSRAELLNQTADFIINAIELQEITASEIAIIAPGLDEIARFTLIERFNRSGINAQPLQEQRPLISSPIIRALLTLLGLLFKGLGRLVEKDAVAEMLVILSQRYQDSTTIYPPIDPVRAGLLADHCYHIDLELPLLLPFEKFPRWDRLNYSSLQVYNYIREWIEDTKVRIKKNSYHPLEIIEQITSYFFPYSHKLNYIQLSNLREFKETAQHFWQVKKQLQLIENKVDFHNKSIEDFIILLRKGTITANPYPFDLLDEKSPINNSITLANIYQYRSFRGKHPWQFWLDIGSNLWNKGGSAELFAYSLFLKSWQEKPISLDQQNNNEKERLLRIVQDLLARTTEKVFLCHSDLAVNGSEQINNSLLILSNLSSPIKSNISTSV